MMYVSTRGNAAPAGFQEVLLAGLAPDGGLYMPVLAAIPSLPALSPGHYAAAAAFVMAPYMGGNPDHDDFLRSSRTLTRDGAIQTPRRLRKSAAIFFSWSCSTADVAFKDFAMQVLSRLMERALKRNGADHHSGRDLRRHRRRGRGGVPGRQDIELFILFPHGRISDVQRKQMTPPTRTMSTPSPSKARSTTRRAS